MRERLRAKYVPDLVILAEMLSDVLDFDLGDAVERRCEGNVKKVASE
jgi:hypothetical protein